MKSAIRTAQGRERVGQPRDRPSSRSSQRRRVPRSHRGDAGSCQRRASASPNDRPSDRALFDGSQLVPGSAQAFPVDLDPSAAHEGQAVGLARSHSISASERFRRQASPPSGSRAAHPSPREGVFPPTVPFTSRRAGRFIRQLTGIRTTTPALSSAGTSFRNWSACCGLQRSGWKISPAATRSSTSGCSAARWMGRSGEQALTVPRTRVLLQGPAKRQMLRLGLS